MKDGKCPMCKSNEVYMTEEKYNLNTGGGRGSAVGGLQFVAQADKETGYYTFDTYVCLSCSYTAMYAHPTDPFNPKGNPPDITFLKKANGWKKAG
jgi:hypothetical protein